MSRRAAMRWCLLPLAAIGSCVAGDVASAGVVDAIEARLGAATLERALPLDAQESIRYFLQAFAFVAAGALVAPRARTRASLALFGCGAWLAWTVLNMWTFPEFHPRGYEVSHLPLWGTWAGGLCAVIGASLPSLRPRG